MIFMKFSCGCFICDNFWMESGGSSHCPRPLFMKKQYWSAQFSKFPTTLVFLSYSELEVTSASFPALLAICTSLPMLITGYLPFLNIRKVSLPSSPAQVLGSPWNLHCDWHSMECNIFISQCYKKSEFFKSAYSVCVVHLVPGFYNHKSPEILCSLPVTAHSSFQKYLGSQHY